MAVKHKDQQTVSTLWMVAMALAGILLGVLSSFVSLQPQVDTLKAQGSQMQSVIQEQNRQIAAMRNQGAGRESGHAVSTAPSTPMGSLYGQVSQSAAANRPIQDLSSHLQSQGTTASTQAPAQTQPSTPSQLTPLVEARSDVPVNAQTSPLKSISHEVEAPQPSKATPTPEPKKPVADKPKAQPAPQKEAAKAPPPTPPTKDKPVKADTATKPAPPVAPTAAPPTTARTAQDPDGLHPEAAKAVAAVAQRDAETGTTPVPKPVSLPPLAMDGDAKPTKALVKATLAQANIAGMDGASVTFKTGLRVQVGHQFPSGERLIAVDPGSKRIETDKRTIVLQVEDKGN